MKEGVDKDSGSGVYLSRKEGERVRPADGTSFKKSANQNNTQPKQEQSHKYPVVVRESAPITTPPSYSTAIMEV